MNSNPLSICAKGKTASSIEPFAQHVGSAYLVNTFIIGDVTSWPNWLQFLPILYIIRMHGSNNHHFMRESNITKNNQ